MELSQELDSALIVWDKISYINVAFAYYMHSLRAGKGSQFLSYGIVRQFVTELVRSKVTSPDPYFFFTMIFFPEVLTGRDGKVMLKSLREDTFKDFIRCMKRLRDFKQDDFYWVKARFVFFLGPGDNNSMERFILGSSLGKRL